MKTVRKKMRLLALGLVSLSTLFACTRPAVSTPTLAPSTFTPLMVSLTATSTAAPTKVVATATMTETPPQAHALGLKIMLKIQLDPLVTTATHWRAMIDQDFTEAQWNEWFVSYTEDENDIEHPLLPLCRYMTGDIEPYSWERLLTHPGCS